MEDAAVASMLNKLRKSGLHPNAVEARDALHDFFTDRGVESDSDCSDDDEDNDALTTTEQDGTLMSTEQVLSSLENDGTMGKIVEQYKIFSSI
jgi:hypothetical protein